MEELHADFIGSGDFYEDRYSEQSKGHPAGLQG